MAQEKNYDSKAIEEKAITEIKRYFEDSKTVATYLNDNDKEPFFDGNIYLYRGGKRDNTHFIGRVAVQIKGKALDRFNDNTLSYSIDLVDLKAYLHEGIAYFVVGEVKRKKRIYYRLLTPIEIRNIIEEKGEQHSCSISMKRATDKQIKTVIAELIQFERDCKKQISHVDSKPVEFEDLEKMNIHSFSVDLTVKNKKENIFLALTKEPVFIYASINEDLKVPLGSGPVNISLQNIIKKPVKIDERTFFDQYSQKMDKGLLILSIGDCFKMVINPNDKQHRASLSISRGAKKLKDVINEAEFLLELQKTKRITIGETTLPVPFPDEHELTKGLQEGLTQWHELNNALQMVGSNIDMDMSLLSPEDEKTLDVLIDMVYYGHARDLNNVIIGINKLTIANLNLWLMIYKNIIGKYEIKSLFDNSLGLTLKYKYPDGVLNESIFSAFDREMLLECDNLPFRDVIPSYEALKEVNPHVYERANLFMLELIAAYDMTDCRN